MRNVRNLTVFAASVAALISGSALAQAQADLVVSTGGGEVRGFAKQDVENFFGIPYAAPPKGDLRWKAPQPPAFWNEVRDATNYGAACPQAEGLDSVRTTDEDCLFVNVQRPAGAKENDKLPVVVLIHGGGWKTGSGNNENLNAIVSGSKVVGVTMNYRLGHLGSFPHPALEENGDAGNYGILDQQAALRWVKDNIAKFGGDPEQVTVGGESAGGGSACQLLAAPSANGLYSRAFMMSTPCDAIPKETAEKTGLEAAKALGCEGDDAAACLRALPVDAFIDAKNVFSRPVSGTTFLPKSGWELMKEGTFPKVPVLIGGNRDEGRSFLTDWESRSVKTWDEEGYEKLVRDTYGKDADAVLSVYSWPENADRYTGTYLAAEVMMANRSPEGGLSACKTNQITDRLQQQGSQVWAYEFAPANGPGWFEIPGYVWGTGHAVELPYLIPDRGNFANNGKALSADHKKLSDTMLAYWGAFIRAGNPAAEGQPEWPAYKTEGGPVMTLRENDKSAALPAVAFRSRHHCDLWDTIANRK